MIVISCAGALDSVGYGFEVGAVGDGSGAGAAVEGARLSNRGVAAAAGAPGGSGALPVAHPVASTGTATTSIAECLIVLPLRLMEVTRAEPITG
ncbi:hypothetical protein [Kineococcus xinjiangensis]|uniref:hypothetical protein n=1 Tax=Kineococcus xinjiangensis TaxID=512762 RepID=UPI001304C0B2|nr:hypothetical protein [Kineococcus xinjiangensis]